MVEVVNTIPKLLEACSSSCSIEGILNNYVLPLASVFEDYVREHLSESYSRLAARVWSSMQKHPRLPQALKELMGELDLNEIRRAAGESLDTLAGALGLSGKPRVKIVFMNTGFDSALSAYGSTVYVGLEWFIDPERIGVKPGTTMYRVMKKLSRNPLGFIEANIIHELTHLLTPRVEGDKVLARVIEEGRAVYTAWLLTRASRTTIIPVLTRELREYATCLPKLLEELKKHVAGESKLREEELFTIHERDKACSLELTGYYLGFYTAQILHDYYNGSLKKLLELNNTRVLEEILKQQNHAGGEGKLA